MPEILGILFDVYGTLVEIQRPQRPYKRLFELARNHAHTFDRDQATKMVMCQQVDLEEAANRFGVTLSAGELKILEQSLSEEIASIYPYPETIRVLHALRKLGLQIGICSNLALPYVNPVATRLGHLIDHATWSCTAGALKPDVKIFEAAVKQFGLQPASILMVGNSYHADVLGAQGAGLRTLFLDRTGERGDISSLDDLMEHVSES